jgi:hypothetical protein
MSSTTVEEEPRAVPRGGSRASPPTSLTLPTNSLCLVFKPPAIVIKIAPRVNGIVTFSDEEPLRRGSSKISRPNFGSRRRERKLQPAAEAAPRSLRQAGTAA